MLDFDEVVKSNVDSKVDWNMIGLCRAQLGEPSAAAQAYRRALAVDPSFKVNGVLVAIYLARGSFAL